MTVQVMVEDFEAYGLTDADADRIEVAFKYLGPRIQRWPTAKAVLEVLPGRQQPKLLQHEITPERRAKALKHISEIPRMAGRK